MTDTVESHESVLAEMRAELNLRTKIQGHESLHEKRMASMADRLAAAHAREVGELRAVNRRDVEMLNAWADRAKQAEARAEAAESCADFDAAIDAHLSGGEG